MLSPGLHYFSTSAPVAIIEVATCPAYSNTLQWGQTIPQFPNPRRHFQSSSHNAMPVVTNGRVIYVEHPKAYYEPGVHTKYVEEQLDTDTVPLNGGVLIKTLLISADPYMRYRMRDPSVPHFSPALVIGQP